ncbi:DUF4942 domain-containing protein [Alteromonas sp. 14N.309.X.WAT.G.H12]|uniref:DUF4942 domain-containing protein n=1 Tax=Alteromonas sp. 14N.309.X.WAT.G.H12 TaxID=3120824 RepID=UPI002FCF4183
MGSLIDSSLRSVTDLETGLGNTNFSPVNTNVISLLFEDYERQVNDIKEITSVLRNKEQALNVLASNNPDRPGETSFLLDEEGAIKHLNAQFWQRALVVTDVYQYLSNSKRKEWDELIKGRNTPGFSLEVVVPTLKDLINQRERMLAETIDEIFRALSGEHVTNQPMGFSKRMIMAPKYTSRYFEISSEIIGNIADLRSVIAFLMGRKGIGLSTTQTQIKMASRYFGQWVDLDGGAVRVRIYKKGTIHLEVHPEMVWRLNGFLALLYPMAIPPNARKKHKKRAKVRELKNKLISGDALHAIIKMKNPLAIDEKGKTKRDEGLFCLPFDHRDMNNPPAHYSEVNDIMVACGGTPEKSGYGMPGWRFDYDFEALRETLVLTGVVPDKRSHQYYFTPESLARRAVSWCEIESQHSCLEPSAGQGHIAKLMPGNTECIEISVVQSAILKSKGFNVIHTDFLEWAVKAKKYDRIVMNPPYSNNQARIHVDAAAELLNEGGKLVAILPASLKDETLVNGLKHEWSDVIQHAFISSGTRCSVVMLRLSC